jgi:hypothetical protein
MSDRYEINHISDLMNIPEDRLTVCLSELEMAINQMRPLAELTTEVAEIMGVKNLELKGKPFVWIDDNKGEITTTISDGKKDALSLKSTPLQKV